MVVTEAKLCPESSPNFSPVQSTVQSTVQSRVQSPAFTMTPLYWPLVSYSLHEGVNSLTQAEVNHAPGSYVYSMGILYGANFNMADRTAGQLESTLRVSNACAKAFEARTS